MGSIEKGFEKLIWSSRLVVIVAVVVSLVSSVALFYMATIDGWHMVLHLLHYGASDLTMADRVQMRGEAVTHVVEMVDGYLLATFLLIFGMGLYELYISKIEDAEGTDVASSVLVVHSLDDLKGRLAKVVLMILIVRYFEYALGMSFKTPLDLLYFAMGIAFLGVALWVAHLADKKH